MGCEGETTSACHFALVSYIPGRLAEFLDQLRFELKPGCVLRSHVTVLPPRPIPLDIKSSVGQISSQAHETVPFTVELGAVEIFEKSNVVYLALRRGAPELEKLHTSLNCAQLQYKPLYCYHPHITLAQDLTPEQALVAAETARRRWASYDGPREFFVDELSFVRSYQPGLWEDLAHVEMAQPVAVNR